MLFHYTSRYSLMVLLEKAKITLFVPNIWSRSCLVPTRLGNEKKKVDFKVWNQLM